MPTNPVSKKSQKYYVKSLIYGWKEVSKERYEAYRNNILNHSTPPKLTRQELAAKNTKIEYVKEK